MAGTDNGYQRTENHGEDDGEEGDDERIAQSLQEKLIAVISVIIVVILLMPRRVAEVSALSIPITIFSSVGIFYLFGMELNTVTLAALIVTLGMVVDDSVVIIDNYYTQDAGKTHVESCYQESYSSTENTERHG